MPDILPAELAELAPAAPQQAVPWGHLFALRQLWLITIAYFCYAWGSWFYFGWFTPWLVRGAGFSIRQMGVVAALPFVLGLLGNLAGGVLSERFVKHYGRRAAYRGVTAICLVTTASLLAGMSVTPDKMKIAVLASLGLGVMDLMLPSAWAMCMSLGGEFGGTATAVMNTAGNLGGWVGAIVFGYVVAATGSYNAPLRLVAAMVLVSALLFARVDCTLGLAEAA